MEIANDTSTIESLENGQIQLESIIEGLKLEILNREREIELVNEETLQIEKQNRDLKLTTIDSNHSLSKLHERKQLARSEHRKLKTELNIAIEELAYCKLALGKTNNNSSLESDFKLCNQRFNELLHHNRILESQMQILESEMLKRPVSKKVIQFKIKDLHDLQEHSKSIMRENKELRKLVNSTKQTSFPTVDIHEQQEMVNISSQELQKCASENQALLFTIDRLKSELTNTSFPGQQMLLEEQLAQAIDKHTSVQENLQALVVQNHDLQRNFEEAKIEIHNMRNSKERVKMDNTALLRLSKQSASLSAEVLGMKQMMSDKDKHIKQASKQIHLLIEQLSKLEQEKNLIESKLRFANNDEVQQLTLRLSECKQNGVNISQEAFELRTLLKQLSDHNKLSENKIRSFVDVLKLTEDTKLQMAKLKSSNVSLKSSVSQCEESRREMKRKMEILDSQYQSNLLEHQNALRSAREEIAILQNRPISREQLKQVVKQVRADMARDPFLVNPNFQRMRESSRSNLNQTEAQRFMSQEHTIIEMNRALSKPNNPTLEFELEEIERKGRERDAQFAKDMLELRAVNLELQREADDVKSAQYRLMNDAKRYVKENAKKMVSFADPQFVRSDIHGAQTALRNAQEAYMSNSLNDLRTKYEDQQIYSEYLGRNILPRMEEARARVEQINMPKIDEIREKLDQQLENTRVRVGQEQAETIDQERGISVLEQRLNAMRTERAVLSDSIDKWIHQPSPQARTDVIEAARADEREYFERARSQSPSDKPLTLNLVAQVNPNGKSSMRLNTDTSVVTVMVDGKPYKYPFDTNTVLGNPAKLLEPNVGRFQRAVQDRKDLIVVTYAYDSVTDARYFMFLHALEKIWITVQNYMGTNNVFSAQMIQLSKDQNPIDLFADDGRERESDCGFPTCKLKMMEFQKDITVKAMMEQIKPRLPREFEETTHVVLSLLFPDHKIHIVDVLFQSSSITDLRLMDRAWIDYLSFTLKQNNYFIDIFLVLLNSDDRNSESINNKLLNLNMRIALFLNDFQRISNQQ